MEGLRMGAGANHFRTRRSPPSRSLPSLPRSAGLALRSCPARRPDAPRSGDGPKDVVPVRTRPRRILGLDREIGELGSCPRQLLGARPAAIIIEEQDQTADVRRYLHPAEALRAERRPAWDAGEARRGERAFDPLGKTEDTIDWRAKAHRAVAEAAKRPPRTRDAGKARGSMIEEGPMDRH